MKVSVLINNYNYGEYLGDCIDSVLNQTYKNIELILYDDGSTDNSIEVAKQYDDKVTIISNPNYGKYPAINQINAVNKAFGASTGEIVCLLDSDDAFEPTKIEEVVKEFKKGKEDLIFVHHLFYPIDENNRVLSGPKPNLRNVENYKEHIYETNHLFELFSFTSCLAFRRSFLQKVLPIKEDDFPLVCIDGRLRLMWLFHGKGKLIKKPLTYYRVHGNNFSPSFLRDPESYEQYVNQTYRFFNDFARQSGYPTIEVLNTKELRKNSVWKDKLEEKTVLNFIKNARQDQEVLLWGAGEVGQSVKELLNQHKLSINWFIDKDAINKQGRILDGIKVISPNGVDYKNKKVIICTVHGRNEVEKFLKNEGLEKNKDFIFPFESNIY